MRRVAALLVLLLAPAAAAAQNADLIFRNGFVWTVDPERPRAEAVAVRGNRIAALGTDQEVMALRGASTRVIDLEGAFLLPGFCDNHVHFASAARFLEFNIMKTSSQEEFVERVREVTARLEPGEWIVGGMWGAYDQWTEGAATAVGREPFMPDMRKVEELTRRYPMFIRKFDNSEFAANRTALEAVGLAPDLPRGEGIELVKNAAGEWTGVLRGEGVRDLFSARIPRLFSRRRRIQQSLNALAEIRSYGVTSVSDMSDDVQLDIYRELRLNGRLTVRIDFRSGLERWNELAAGSGDHWIHLGAVKGHVDGIMGTSSARFFEPYAHDPENRGRWRRLLVDEEGNFAGHRFLDLMTEADRAGIQLSIHAIGDEANNLLLDYLDELDRRNGEKDRRFRLVHAQVIADRDFPRLGEHQVVAEVQPFHLSDDMRWMEERIGRERSRGAYAFRRIQDSGAILSFGTDWPGTSAAEYPINPMLGLHAAVTRQTVTGEPEGGWFPQERISIEEAIRAYTWNTAYATFEEDVKGSLEVGKLADMTVLDRNLIRIDARELLETRVLYTVVDGKIVYRGERQPQQ